MRRRRWRNKSLLAQLKKTKEKRLQERDKKRKKLENKQNIFQKRLELSKNKIKDFEEMKKIIIQKDLSQGSKSK